MDTRSGSQCSVTPEAIRNNEELVLPPRISRVNGWSLPLHYFRVVTWAVFVGLSLATFRIFIPLLPHSWKYIAYVVTGGIFSFHLVVHLIASCIDPADSNVRLMKNYSQPMPLFDRSKHAHVIQNQFCHLCKVTVNKKTKHCISCNKCVSGFDHHCKWINNCVGSRNYWFFFSTVASATAGMLCLIAILLYVLVQYLVNPRVLRTDPRYEAGRQSPACLRLQESAGEAAPTRHHLMYLLQQRQDPDQEDLGQRSPSGCRTRLPVSAPGMAAPALHTARVVRQGGLACPCSRTFRSQHGVTFFSRMSFASSTWKSLKLLLPLRSVTDASRASQPLLKHFLKASSTLARP
uniref:Palmitoyltransferase n=1 Tax=Homo sapiens TaxID=9606 RepID=A0A7P0TA36_HUMAN